jgi:hypothetical protein
MKRKKFAVTAIIVFLLGLMIVFICGHSPLPLDMKERIIASGKFHQVAHIGEGTATIYKLLNGERVLSLTDFRTGEGQNLEVYLISATDAFENDTVEKSAKISLGVLQNVQGEQVFRLSEEVDLNLYKAVTIWSTKYRVNFTTAPLISSKQ